MPIVYNDALDDQLVFDGSTEFVGGEFSQSDPSKLQPTQCSKLRNIVLDQLGNIITRKGTTLLGSALAAAKVQGISDFNSATVQKILAACNGAMYQNAGSGAWSTAAGYTPTSASVNVEIVQGIDVLYVADGTKNLYKWDGITFTDLGTGGTNPPIMAILAWHTYRLFGASLTADTLYISDELDGETWNLASQSIRIGGGDGDFISCIASWSDFNFLVFKHNSIWVINADPSQNVADWLVRKVTDRAGCVAHRTGKMVGDDFYFLSRDGVRTILRTLNDAQSQVSIPISRAVQPIIDRINWAYASTASAEYIDNKYMVAVPLDSSTTPNAVLVFDTLLKVCIGYWEGTGWTPSCFLFSKLGNGQTLYFGNQAGQVLSWNYNADSSLSTSYLDNGSAIATTARTGSYTFNEMISPKTGWNIEVEFNQSLAVANLYAILDQNSTNQPIALAFDTFGTTNSLPVNLPFDLAVLTIARKAFDLASLGEFREIQFEISSTSGKLAIKQILSSAFINTMRYET